MSTPGGDRPAPPRRVPRPEDLDLTVRLTHEEFQAVAEAARWAPSIHNSQPGLLRRLPDGIGVREDLTRSLPVIDPFGRDRTISCGAALFNARAAMRALGHLPSVEVLPDPGDPTMIGVARSTGYRPAAPGDLTLHRLMPHRRTHRRVYRSHVIAEDDLLDLRHVVAGEGARLNVADGTVRRQLVDVLRRAVRSQAADTELRREVDSWVRRGPTGSQAVDGIPLAALGTSPYPVDSLVHGDHLGLPDPEEIEAELARSTILVVSTREDSRQDWVVAGMALERLLLTATASGLVATFTDQALQNQELRTEIAQVLDIWGYPQVLFRIGRPLVEAPRTPRRPLAQLVE